MESEREGEWREAKWTDTTSRKRVRWTRGRKREGDDRLHASALPAARDTLPPGLDFLSCKDSALPSRIMDSNLDLFALHLSCEPEGTGPSVLPLAHSQKPTSEGNVEKTIATRVSFFF